MYFTQKIIYYIEIVNYIRGRLHYFHHFIYLNSTLLKYLFVLLVLIFSIKLPKSSCIVYFYENKNLDVFIIIFFNVCVYFWFYVYHIYIFIWFVFYNSICNIAVANYFNASFQRSFVTESDFEFSHVWNSYDAVIYCHLHYFLNFLFLCF